mmetsp:Transcript_34501/g.89945  ORF Transcript_34501/g.89945 Transcript_34501/m.89945 type:complete len:337 (+) Transcript_34501:66-1076(+)
MSDELEPPVNAVQSAKTSYQPSFFANTLGWSGTHCAVGSFEKGENAQNKVEVLGLDEKRQLYKRGEANVPFPVTKIMYAPRSGEDGLFATAGHTLQLWKTTDSAVECVKTLTNTRNSRNSTPPPLTSLDWSSDHNKIGTSSIDTTCTIWNLELGKVETQLIAHDKAVFDIAFSNNANLFASVGADGSLRLFDQRNLDHSTIVYEITPAAPLLRLAWNQDGNSNLIASAALNTEGITALDIRRPGVALSYLHTRNAAANSFCWAPPGSEYANHVMVGLEDGTTVMWDVQMLAQSSMLKASPRYAFDAGEAVQSVVWDQRSTDSIAIATGSSIQVVPI